MHEAIKQMLSRYPLGTVDEGVNALRELTQELALLGLWRARFFEHAAFYGGTALRIFHGLDRFSEDLDFTLLKQDPDFQLARFTDSLSRELQGFGFELEVTTRKKAVDTAIQSAFLKGNTRHQLLEIGIPRELASLVHSGQKLKVKLEIDTDPPPSFSSEMQTLLQPIPFAVRVCSPPDLFAGKLHALLFRRWKSRVKGRDWYDFVWFVGRGTPVNLSHLEQRMRQTGDWEGSKALMPEDLFEALEKVIRDLDVDQARNEVRRFLRNQDALALWSQDFFHDISRRVTISGV
ncbi:MAG: nucleotidyl transferase AbiEii/AbiGii toxin family protein [Candidatus Krumholzibacteria bacterium]|jgi:predicted nucleotidyltransferase component of viral defense system|nr:nucleotidyl transferase AbiEii/AbiGii toxin family protein [Candidatus Krumholzibacteria bacterium]MDP6668941.1 nucleotidyl transferase AbiEii/AbiGii toxin family protein [Candidatus Krumholzibacteria bacterium]MDP7022355.1 nucleotidyl transferase AbiEii/AbiGii toxin family protein [Candidatus Krumholzibacteria bacterium]